MWCHRLRKVITQPGTFHLEGVSREQRWRFRCSSDMRPTCWWKCLAVCISFPGAGGHSPFPCPIRQAAWFTAPRFPTPRVDEVLRCQLKTRIPKTADECGGPHWYRKGAWAFLEMLQFMGGGNGYGNLCSPFPSSHVNCVNCYNDQSWNRKYSLSETSLGQGRFLLHWVLLLFSVGDSSVVNSLLVLNDLSALLRLMPSPYN